MIYGSLIASIASQFATSIVFLAMYLKYQQTGYLVGGASFFVFALLSVYLLRLWKSRIPFAKVTLTTVTEVIAMYPAVVFTGIIGLFAQTLFSVFWISAIIGFSQLQIVKTLSEVALGFLGLYALLIFYWTSQVIMNIVHVTVSGVFATYYFLGQADEDGEVAVAMKNPTISSAKRAMTTSLGPICYGSLLIALVQVVRAVIQFARQNAQEDNNVACTIFLCCLECIISAIEGLLEYFNRYVI